LGRASVGGARIDWSFWTLVGAVIVATTLALLAFDGNLVLALLPSAGLLALAVLFRVPLRWTALVLIALALTLENPAEIPACNRWQSPLYPLGAVLLTQLKHTTQIRALVMTGMDVVLVVLFCVYALRRAAGSCIDTRGSTDAPRPLVWAAGMCLFGALAMLVWGMARGGVFRFSLWQVQRIIYLPLVFLFLQLALPGPAVNQALGRVVVVCACIKSALALYLRSLMPDLEYATVHADSMLFATAACLLLILVFEQPNRRNVVRAVILLPLLTAGMIANDRRLVWVELAVALGLVFMMNRWTLTKVKAVRAGLVALPAIPIYLGLGWNSPTGIFSPVGILRSVVDSQSDPSTRWRDLENFNLVMTLRHNPILGTGFGHPFEFAVPLPDVTMVYELEPYVPHNSLLGIWAYTGYVGFAMLWTLLVVGVYLAVRTYRYATRPVDRVAALTSFAAIVVYMIHCYGDMGLGTWTSVFLIGPSLVVVGKLSVAVGAWPGFRPSAASRAYPSGGQRPALALDSLR
jgi:hypothetical protein